MPIYVTPRSDRQAVSLLLQYEHWRAWWWLGGAALLLLVVPVMAVGSFILGAYLVDDFHHPARVVAGAVIAVGLGQLVSGPVWRRKPWTALISRRLARYAEVPRRSDGTTRIAVGDDDLPRALRQLRRAKLAVAEETRLLDAPLDAPELHNHLVVYKADWLRADGDAGAGETAQEELAKASIRARVDGHDVRSEPQL